MPETTTLPVRVVDGRAVPVAGTYTLDPSHAQVGFTARHMMVSKVRGTFERFDATLVVAERPEDSSVEATIEVGSVTTRDEQRDGHLRSADFFDAETHPTMTFRSGAVRPVGESTWEVEGVLTIRGVAKPVTLTVEFEGAAESPFGGTAVGFSAVAEVDREDWGLTWNQPLASGGVLVGKKVKLEIEAEFTAPAD